MVTYGDVVIPFHGRVDLLLSCLRAIAAGGAHSLGIFLLVDDGSPADQARQAMRECLALPLRIRWLTLPERSGFVRAVNVGWAATSANATIILNSDTVVSASVLSGLCRALDNNEDVAAVAPGSTNPADLYQYRTWFTPKANDSRTLTFAPYLTAMCIALRREAIQGPPFDEAYSPGYFEDLDLCCRLRVLGWKLGIAEWLTVQHTGRATFASHPELVRILARNYALFASRWGGISEHGELVQLLDRVSKIQACS